VHLKASLTGLICRGYQHCRAFMSSSEFV